MPLISKPSPAAAVPPSAPAPKSAGVIADEIRRQSDLRSRGALFTELVCLRSAEAVQAIIPFISSDDAGLRTGAMDALRAMPELALPQLPNLLRSPDNDVRQLACELARFSGDAEGSQLLCTLLTEDPDINVCAAAIDVLAEIGDDESVAALQRCAERFYDQPFIGFAIKTAVERITKSSNRRG